MGNIEYNSAGHKARVNLFLHHFAGITITINE